MRWFAKLWAFVEKEARYRNLDLRLQLADNLPKIASDRGQLQQVFLNLLSNAFGAVEDRGAITICTCDCGEVLSVSVEDNGCGMSEEMLQSRFTNLFFPQKRRDMEQGSVCSLPTASSRGLGGASRPRARKGRGLR